jgi:CRISPR-associated protein Cmr1
MRKIPKEIIDLGKSLKIELKETGRITQVRKYKLITPLFGGGVSPRENDPSKLIRETSIRGQLRFWWRALRGSGSLEEMKKREDAIFGSTNQEIGQSKVSIVVKNIQKGNEEFIFNSNDKNKPFKKWERVAYAAFALQPTKEEPEQKSIRIGVAFEIEISFPSQKDEENDIDFPVEVEAALWAWETFGGIGGRTRRGFGAVELLSLTENGKEKKIEKYRMVTVEDQIRADLKKHLLPDKRCDQNTPHLKFDSIFKVKRAANSLNAWKNAIENAWKNAIELYKNFRQFRRDKNTHKESNFGKSQWSEPNSIRYIDGRRENERIVKFPRSNFGLPVIFHFPKDKPELKDFTLKLKDYERLASPLILRPIACSDGAVSIALLLEFPRASNLSLEVISEDKRKGVSAKLTLEEAKQLTEDGLTPLNYKTDVLQAFLDFFAKH